MNDLAIEIKELCRREVGKMHTSIVARIMSVDRQNATVAVKPYGRLFNDKERIIDYPIIYNVPLATIGSAINGLYVAVPVAVGDNCILLFNECDNSLWLGNEQKSMSKFEMNDAIAIPFSVNYDKVLLRGCFEKNQILAGNGENRISISKNAIEVHGNIIIGGESADKIAINGDTYDCNRSSGFQLLA